MLRTLAFSSLLTLALAGIAVAQTAPAAAPVNAPDARRAAFAERGATLALRGAYRAIAEAEARGSSAYLDAAKTHYRGALARFARHDRGAASEAMAAAALARAALAEHPVPPPRDIPAPPALVAGTGPHPLMPRPPAVSPIRGGIAAQLGPEMRGGMHRRHGGRMPDRFDAARLAADVKLADTPEARDLAQKALDADIARTRAAFGGSADEAQRQGRLARALATAVHALALADHPPAFTL